MIFTRYILLLLSVSIFAQESIETTFIKKTDYTADTLVSIDNFGTEFYVNNTIFYKKDAKKTISYNNFQLGELHNVNTFNPLKINLFYKDFNTVVILDNRLAEIFKLDFNALSDYKNVSFVSTGHDNTLWIFNQDFQQLELFDYKNLSTRAQTAPVQSQVLDLKSNYNYCWLLTKKHLYIYNYFGGLVKKITNDGYTALTENNGNIILKKEQSLYYLDGKTHNIKSVKIPNLLINAFFVTNETLYIYDNETLQEFQLKIN
ncbi:hypothetical protein [uncultured Algibacter sp.]|uniref:hypothetical protein n=1 Tax=uncultured Algibacter sp. TaxID=298659 RepID=UPI0032178E01